MDFSELNPKISGTDISFDCAKCGHPHRIWIAARYRQAPSVGVWCWDAPVDSPNGYNAITITPSINNHHHGRKSCGWHVTITNGEVKE